MGLNQLFIACPLGGYIFLGRPGKRDEVKKFPAAVCNANDRLKPIA
jgi:hypothetical protein